ncbi:MAG: D-alanyl-D-alanine carboxypeptidase [Eubacterium sp.]|nr:D-alanyl-D-alanine carboxypeptidase [Eubacterium sp.]
MKRLTFLLALLFIFPMTAYGADNSARCAIVMDADTGIILYEKNAYEERSIASTTKIMTALLAIESDRLNETVKITNEMLQTEGSSLGLREGDTLTLSDLVTGMMLTSGNDSANAVAFFISGGLNEFSALMNKRAAEIGMNNSYFVTPSGLDEGGHHSTAYDMALLTATAVQNKTFCEIVSKQSAEIIIGKKKMTVYNHNKLLARDKNFFGVKTGYTKKAGRCLVSAKNYNDSKLICVTLSAPDDWNDHINLLKECEKKYNKYDVSGNIEINVVGADVQTVKATYQKDLYVLSDLKLEIYHCPFVYAPIKKGERLGWVYVYYNEKLIERLPIKADEDVKYYAEQERSTLTEVYG